MRGFGAGGAEAAVGGEASGEEVVHQAGFDLLIFGDEGFGLLDAFV